MFGYRARGTIYTKGCHELLKPNAGPRPKEPAYVREGSVRFHDGSACTVYSRTAPAHDMSVSTTEVGSHATHV